MRTSFATLLFLGPLSGCTTAYDGTWLVTATLKDDSCNPDNDYIGTDSQLFINTFTTQAGTFGTGLDGLILTGVRTGTEFEVSYEYGTSTESSSCDTIQSLAEWVMEGSFTADGGMEADLDSSDADIIADCEDNDMEEDSVCESAYSLSGIRLHADPDQHPFYGVQSGSLPGGGGGGYY